MTAAKERGTIDKGFNITTNNVDAEKDEKKTKKLNDIVHLIDNEQSEELNGIRNLKAKERRGKSNEIEILNNRRIREKMNDDAKTKMNIALKVSQDQASEDEWKAAKKQVKQEEPKTILI